MTLYLLRGEEVYRLAIVEYSSQIDAFALSCFRAHVAEAPAVCMPRIRRLHELEIAVLALGFALTPLIRRLLTAEAACATPEITVGDYVRVRVGVGREQWSERAYRVTEVERYRDHQRLCVAYRGQRSWFDETQLRLDVHATLGRANVGIVRPQAALAR